MGVECLLGKTMRNVYENGDELVFEVNDNERYKLFHYQSCCESVRIEDIEGNLQDLVGSPLTQSEEVSLDEPYAGSDSYTWTFYKFATIKGYVTVRWLGESNGYYSESVDFVKY